MEKIAIIGAGGFGQEILTVINAINAVKEQYQIIGYIDNLPKGTIINGYPVIGNDEFANTTKEKLSVVLSIGDAHLKKNIVSKYTNKNISFPTLIHPSVIISDKKSINIGKGCIICAGSILTTNIQIEDFVTINLQCTVGHNTIIKSYSSFMPGCNISGNVIINEGVYCGTGVKIINDTEIGRNSIIGAGAVVTKNIPDNCTAVGIPAKPIKYQ